MRGCEPRNSNIHNILVLHQQSHYSTTTYSSTIQQQHGIPADHLRGAVPPPKTPIAIGRIVLRGFARLAASIFTEIGEGGGQDTQRGDAGEVRRRCVAFPEGSPRQGELVSSESREVAEEAVPDVV